MLSGFLFEFIILELNYIIMKCSDLIYFMSKFELKIFNVFKYFKILWWILIMSQAQFSFILFLSTDMFFSCIFTNLTTHLLCEDLNLVALNLLYDLNNFSILLILFVPMLVNYEFIFPHYYCANLG